LQRAERKTTAGNGPPKRPRRLPAFRFKIARIDRQSILFSNGEALD
jgi:hypothetical protein